MEGPEKSSKNRPSAIDPEFCWWIVHGKSYLELLLFFLNTGFYPIKKMFKVSMSNKEITTEAATWVQKMPFSTIRIPLCHHFFFCFKVSLGDPEHVYRRKKSMTYSWGY